MAEKVIMYYIKNKCYKYCARIIFRVADKNVKIE